MFALKLYLSFFFLHKPGSDKSLCIFFNNLSFCLFTLKISVFLRCLFLSLYVVSFCLFMLPISVFLRCLCLSLYVVSVCLLTFFLAPFPFSIYYLSLYVLTFARPEFPWKTTSIVTRKTFNRSLRLERRNFHRKQNDFF